MIDLIKRVYRKSALLFYAGLLSLAFYCFCLISQQFNPAFYLGESAWGKPARYGLSGWIFLWTMSLMLHHLNSRSTRLLLSFGYSLCTIALITVVYTDTYFYMQGGLDEQNGLILSKSVLYLLFFGIMCWTSLLFLKQRKNPRSQHYTWGLRMSLLIFTGTSLLGLIMYFLGTYTVGGVDGSPGIPFFNWSKHHGDLRLVLFLGFHSIQIIPVLSHFLFEKKKQVVFFALIYMILVLVALFFTLLGQSFF
jgi:hypothetical protein